MKFFSIFNLIYKLFSKRGKRALIVTFIICVIMFVFSSPFVFAFDDTITLDLSSFGKSESFQLTFPSTFVNVQDLSYLVVNAYDNDNNIGLYFSYNVPYIIQQNNGSYNIGADGGFYVAWYNTNGFSWASTSTQSYFTLYNNYNTQANTYIYTDSTLSNIANINSFVVNNDLIVDVNNSGGSSNIDYTNTLNHIDTQVTSTNTIVESIDNTTQSIDNRVYQIQVILQDNLNQNEVTNAITSTSQTTQNIISNTSASTQNQIEQSRIQSQQQFNTITNTTTYNNNDVVIDTSFNDITDVNGVDNFIVRLYNLLYGKFSSFDFSINVSLIIPIPFTNSSFELSTEPLQNFYSQHLALSSLITMAWYFVFGVYLFRLAYTFWISAVNGNIIKDTEGFTAKIDEFSPIRMFMM